MNDGPTDGRADRRTRERTNGGSDDSSGFLTSRNSAASIRFEVWGVVNPVQEIFDSNRNFFLDFPDKFLIFQAKISDDLLFLVLNSKYLSFSYKKDAP